MGKATYQDLQLQNQDFLHIYAFIYISHIWLNGLNVNVYTGVLEPEHTASGKDQNGQDC